MLKVFGRRNSANVQKILWFCGEQDLDYDLTEVGGAFGQTKDEWFRQLNPNGLVPVIVDDGLTLWESNAILRYLDGRYGDATERSPAARALADQWMDWTSSVVMERAAMPAAFVGLVRTAPQSRDQAAIARGAVLLARAFGILDAHLANHRFVAGDTFSIGDMPAAIFAYRWLSMPLEHPPTPHIGSWIDSIAKRPPFQRYVAGPLT